MLMTVKSVSAIAYNSSDTILEVINEIEKNWGKYFNPFHIRALYMVNFPKHIDTISMGWSILYFKGLPVNISTK